MSAIFGIVRQAAGDATCQKLLASMSAALAPCGPHGEGSWCDGAIGLGVRMLHDTPEAVFDQQPVSSAATGAVLVADARIDNRDELVSTLRIEADTHAPISDSTLILAAWDRWGDECGRYLEGDFSFAVWDPRVRRLFCARDLMGVKPFYYYQSASGVVFASQLAGLLALDTIPRRLDRRAAADHLLLLMDDTTRTLFAGLSRLPAGHALVVNADGRAATSRYQKVAPRPGVVFSSERDWAEALRSELERATAVRMRATGAVGGHLSGGLDSSAILCMAARHRRPGDPPLRAITYSSPPVEGNPTVDQSYIRDVLEHTGASLRYSPFSIERSIDAPESAAPGMLAPYFETERDHRWAQGEGIRVMLSGWGGDEGVSFNGRGYLTSLIVRGRWLELWTIVRDLRRIGKVRRPAGFILSQLDPLLPDTLHQWIRRRMFHDRTVDRLAASCMSADLARELGLDNRVNKRVVRRAPSARAFQLTLITYGHLQRRMESWSADASRFGIEYRYPLLDRGVVELALALPERAWIQGGQNRYPFRAALEGILPESVRSRPDKVDSIDLSSKTRPRVEALARFGMGVAERLARDGNDLGGCLDIDKLRGYLALLLRADGTRRERNLAFASSSLAVGLALFVERHGVDCSR